MTSQSVCVSCTLRGQPHVHSAHPPDSPKSICVVVVSCRVRRERALACMNESDPMTAQERPSKRSCDCMQRDNCALGYHASPNDVKRARLSHLYPKVGCVHCELPANAVTCGSRRRYRTQSPSALSSRNDKPLALGLDGAKPRRAMAHPKAATYFKHDCIEHTKLCVMPYAVTAQVRTTATHCISSPDTALKQLCVLQLIEFAHLHSPCTRPPASSKSESDGQKEETTEAGK